MHLIAIANGPLLERVKIKIKIKNHLIKKKKMKLLRRKLFLLIVIRDTLHFIDFKFYRG